jgi:hypothetical protein
MRAGSAIWPDGVGLLGVAGICPVGLIAPHAAANSIPGLQHQHFQRRLPCCQVVSCSKAADPAEEGGARRNTSSGQKNDICLLCRHPGALPAGNMHGGTHACWTEWKGHTSRGFKPHIAQRKGATATGKLPQGVCTDSSIQDCAIPTHPAPSTITSKDSTGSHSSPTASTLIATDTKYASAATATRRDAGKAGAGVRTILRFVRTSPPRNNSGIAPRESQKTVQGSFR